MAKSELLYVRGMNISESDVEDDEDVWDDRKLNDAYDKALRIANAEVAKRIAMTTNNQAVAKTEHQPRKERHHSDSRKQKKQVWNVGTPCRAIYDYDGYEYEAIVLRIINEKECVVKFVGYDNSEIVQINTLKPSHGKEEQAKQIEDALHDKADEEVLLFSRGDRMDVGSERATSPNSERSTHKKKKSANKKKKNCRLHNLTLPEMPFPMPNMNDMKNLASMDIPMPPPPPMALSSKIDSEDQAVSSMLLSWYMSGYYTGLYQGMKRAKEFNKSEEK